MTVLVVGGLIIRDGRVLLGRRAAYKRICPDTWDLIGGHVEAGETLNQALMRELSEEIDVRPTRFHEIAQIDFGPEAGRPVRYHMFRVDAFKGQPRLANDEHVALGWFGLAEAAALPDLASARYRPILLAEAEDALR